jgi:hypothetical protein
MGLLGQRRRSGSSAKDPDTRLLSELEARGANLSRPRHVIHTLGFQHREGADGAAATAERAGWHATLGGQADGALWSLRIEDTRVVDDTTVRAFRAWFERLAAAHDGAYEGWEAAAKP